MLTNSSELSKRAERLRSHGITRDTNQSEKRPLVLRTGGVRLEFQTYRHSGQNWN